MKVRIASAIVFLALFSIITLAESKFALAQVALPVTPVTPATSPTPTPITPPAPITPPSPVTPPMPITPPVVIQNSTIRGYAIYEYTDLKADKVTSTKAANVTIEITNLITRDQYLTQTDQFGNFSATVKGGNLYFLRAKDSQNTRFAPNFKLVYANGDVNNIAFHGTKPIQVQNYTVTGRVQYLIFDWKTWRWNLKPAAGTVVQFTNSQTGKTLSATVNPSGNYTISIETGKYQVRPNGKRAFFPFTRFLTIDKPVANLNFQGYSW